ncbi:3-phenylpropionate/cinnamic acid dioxygenase subunit beta [Rhizorhabdus wittichii]|uniref:3-phenylpropionate/cinnamic acid dioxygenase subunit beta n=1 Tax=Rhizorhabdus wittichii TaxID=160791 RepID=A0A975HCB3_9SPHN|nr:3-phenylpropionate/cinnamic acid dioxygenase subunit beta [Rhizorhabdus wittichii]QTH20206.1 3-phenylpropionate/cinnamic acid dioxygenase subunit beta [Rhizorhabdus wittichii]
MSIAAETRPDYSTYPRLSMAEARAAAQHLLAMHGDGAEVDDDTLSRIERFYNREARLLDEERFDEWYALLADDLFYWMPLRENRFRRDSRPEIAADNMALFDESKADIAIRLGRLSSGLVWTEDPPTRHVYIISNVEAFVTGRSGEYEVHSTFTQYRNRSEHDTATLHGRRRDLIRAVEGGFHLVRRLVLLPQSVVLTKNLSAFF